MKYETARKHAEANEDTAGGAMMLVDHHAQTTPTQPGQYGWKKLVSIGVAVAALFYGEATAEATPIWNLENDTVTAPYEDEDLELDVRRFSQTVENISDDGEKLKQYIYPAGSNDGIVHGYVGNDFDNFEWTLTLNLDETILTALNSFYYVDVDGTAIFKFLTTDLVVSDDSTGSATGVASPDGNFPDLQVNIPAIPEPATLSLLALGFLSVLVRGRLGSRPGKNSRNTCAARQVR